MKFAIAFAALFAACNAGVIPYSSIVSPIAPITQYSHQPYTVVASAPQTVIAAPNTLAYAAHHVASPISYAAHYSVAHASPLAYAAYAPHAIQIAHAPAAVEIAHAPVIAKSIVHAPAAIEYVAAPAPVIVAKGEATYVAKNLGAEHVAPLPGHDLSQTSLNLASAPGTL